MSDGEALLLILSLFYLSECFLWVRKQSVAFISPWCREWRVAALNSSLGNSNGALLFVNPLPPLGRVLFSHLSPVSISPRGICAFNLQALPSVGRAVQTGRALTFGEITCADTDGLHLLINKERFAKCASFEQSRTLSRLITLLTRAAASDREKLLRSHLAGRFATEQAAATLRQASRVIKPIRWMCSILFLFLFVMTPILVTIFGLLRVIIPAAVVMIVLAVQIGIMFHRAHKKLYPDEIQERFESVVKMVLCPPVAIRATDLLSKQLLSHYSPVVLATLFSGVAAPRFLRSFVLDLQHPQKHEVADETAAEIITWAAAEQLKFCLEHIKRNGDATPEAMLASPQREENSLSYCPRCGCQFIVVTGECPDCPGVDLLGFANENDSKVESLA